MKWSVLGIIFLCKLIITDKKKVEKSCDFPLPFYVFTFLRGVISLPYNFL
jgi:hypothetical protein